MCRLLSGCRGGDQRHRRGDEPRFDRGSRGRNPVRDQHPRRLPESAHRRYAPGRRGPQAPSTCSAEARSDMIGDQGVRLQRQRRFVSHAGVDGPIVERDDVVLLHDPRAPLVCLCVPVDPPESGDLRRRRHGLGRQDHGPVGRGRMGLRVEPPPRRARRSAGLHLSDRDPGAVPRATEPLSRDL